LEQCDFGRRYFNGLSDDAYLTGLAGQTPQNVIHITVHAIRHEQHTSHPTPVLAMHAVMHILFDRKVIVRAAMTAARASRCNRERLSTNIGHGRQASGSSQR
jgi:hypothetical protein